MNLNFSTFGAEIQEARAKVMDYNGTQDWAMFAYGKDFVVKVVETGDGGLEEIKDEFEGSRIQLGLCRVNEPLSNLPRFVFITWCGDAVPIQLKGQFNNHVHEACKQFHGYHVHINARSEEDVDPESIMKKVKASSGAQYSIQSNVANPSLAKPPPPTKKYVPPISPMHKPAVAPPKAAKNISTAVPVPIVQNEEESKPLFSSVGTTYEPVKTNPKPLSTNVFAEMDKKTSQEKLDGNSSSNNNLSAQRSNTQAIKKSFTNLTKDPSTKSSENIGRTNTQNIKKSFTNLAKDANINSNDSVGSSGYQPIKLEPKPLYGTGVAKSAIGQGTSPYGSATNLKQEQPKFKTSAENVSVLKPDAVSSYIPVKTNPAPLSSKFSNDNLQSKMESVQIQPKIDLEQENRQREQNAQLERQRREAREAAEQEMHRKQDEKRRQEQEMKLQQEQRQREEQELLAKRQKAEQEQKSQKQREEQELRLQQQQNEQRKREEAELRDRQKEEEAARAHQEELERQRLMEQQRQAVPNQQPVGGKPIAVALYDYEKGFDF